MWTVTVVLSDGATELHADQRRMHPDNRTFAWAYHYKVDESNDVLRVYRLGQMYDDWDRKWSVQGAEEEVAYYRSHQWSRVSGT